MRGKDPSAHVCNLWMQTVNDSLFLAWLDTLRHTCISSHEQNGKFNLLCSFNWFKNTFYGHTEESAQEKKKIIKIKIWQPTGFQVLLWLEMCVTLGYWERLHCLAAFHMVLPDNQGLTEVLLNTTALQTARSQSQLSTQTNWHGYLLQNVREHLNHHD